MVALLLLLLVPACGGPQSALDPAGLEAERIGSFFLFMVLGAATIWALLMGTAILAILRRPGRHTERFANTLIIGGGVIFPTIGLAVLLTVGLRSLPDWSGSPADLRIHVHGEQFWWRVAYERGDERIVSANEIHLPAGEPVEFVLTTADVIHSFWMPAIGGKMDMMPGRVNRLTLTPTTPGIYRGACAEFCGPSHALMAFAIVVHPPGEFDDWLVAETSPASNSAETEGRRLFLANGCAACHRIGGIVELGEVGPDLTHVGSRRTLAAGTAPMSRQALTDWITDPQALKPGAGMPAYTMLPEEEILAIADFLLSLE